MPGKPKLSAICDGSLVCLSDHCSQCPPTWLQSFWLSGRQGALGTRYSEEKRLLDTVSLQIRGGISSAPQPSKRVQEDREVGRELLKLWAVSWVFRA
jgi:hypothetical protein